MDELTTAELMVLLVTMSHQMAILDDTRKTLEAQEVSWGPAPEHIWEHLNEAERSLIADFAQYGAIA
jgi:hypothetical protein